MSEIHDLRSYLQVLESAGQLVRIVRPVSLDHELADVAAALERASGPAPLFENADAADRGGGPIAAWPVFSSAVANQTRAALALGCEKGQVVEVMGRALAPANAIQPVRVDDAAWKANVRTGDAVDIRTLPIPIHAAGDGGPFITGGVTVSKDPVSGRGNLSYNRMQVKGPREFGFNLNEWRHTMQFLKGQEALDKPLQVAIAIGLDPAITIAAGARYDGDELCIAGAIRARGSRCAAASRSISTSPPRPRS